jgi:hypothetical protein
MTSRFSSPVLLRNPSPAETSRSAHYSNGVGLALEFVVVLISDNDVVHGNSVAKLLWYRSSRLVYHVLRLPNCSDAFGSQCLSPSASVAGLQFGLAGGQVAHSECLECCFMEILGLHCLHIPSIMWHNTPDSGVVIDGNCAVS